MEEYCVDDDNEKSGCESRDEEGRSESRREEGRSESRREESCSESRREEGRSESRREEGRSESRREESRSESRREEGCSESRCEESLWMRLQKGRREEISLVHETMNAPRGVGQQRERAGRDKRPALFLGEQMTGVVKIPLQINTYSRIHLLTYSRTHLFTMLLLEPHPDGAILNVKAFPGAKKNEIREVSAGMLKVCCTQVPEKGKANKAIQEVLARGLGLRKSQVTLLSGQTDSHKKFLITGITAAELEERIKTL